MLTDIFGNTISVDSTETRDAWDKMQLGFLAHSQITPTHLAEVLQRSPNFALAHAIKGIFCMLLGRREMVEIARGSFSDAKKALLVAPSTKREREFLDTLGLMLDGQPSRALQTVKRISYESPGDALSMKITHAIAFVLGQSAEMLRSIETVLPAYDETHPGYGYLLGCHAFALEENGDYAKAETVGRQSVFYAPDDAWGLHAVAHVYDMTANLKAGLDWLNGREDTWSHCNNFRYHVWWHKALMHLERRDLEEVFRLYDTKIRKDKTDDYRDISNATSLLSRLELEGHDVGNRWEELADLSEKRTEDGCLVFADLHYILALVGGSRDGALKKIIARMNNDARTSKTEIGHSMSDPGVAAAAGLEAFGDANYAMAFQQLASARPKMQTIGGSHAQRDVFERLTIDAGIRGGFFKEAKQILNERKAKRGGAEDRYAAVRFEMLSSAMACVAKPNVMAE